MADYILVAVIAYLIGSIPSGLILGKLFWHTDLREHGSHNIGATNAWRTLGKVPGIAVFIADSLKGQAGVLLGLSFAGTPLAAVIGGLCHHWAQLLAVPALSRRERRCYIARCADYADGECDHCCVLDLAGNCLYNALCVTWFSHSRVSYPHPCRSL